MNFDLHFHSFYSDGDHSPQELLELALAKDGLTCVALTDHDTMVAVPEFRSLCAPHGIEVITGVEITSLWEGKEIHMLSYFVEDQAPAAINDLLERSCEIRKERLQYLCRTLSKFGLNADAVMERFPKTVAYSRVHLAKFLVELGAVSSNSEAFRLCLSNQIFEGKGLFAWPDLMSVADLVNKNKGYAVIAHPGRYGLEPAKIRRMFREFKEAGGAGIEAAHGSSPPKKVKSMLSLADNYDLKVTGGSDFHSSKSSRTQLGTLPLLPQRAPLLLNDILAQRKGLLDVKV